MSSRIDADDAGEEIVGEITVDATPVYLTVAPTIDSKHWKGQLVNWETFRKVQEEHPETEEKNGRAFLPGKLNGRERKKNAVEELGIAVLDCDRGDNLGGIVARLRSLGLEAVVHSSYSHLTVQTLIKFDDYRRFAQTGDVTANLARDYLISKKNLRPEVLGEVTIIEEMRSTADGIFLVAGHDPIQKGRIALLLATPFVVIEQMKRHGLTQQEAQKLWGEYLSAIAEMIGVELDESCKDVSRAFFFAAHPPGSEFFYEHVHGRAFDLAELGHVSPKLKITQSKRSCEEPAEGAKNDGAAGTEYRRFAAKYGNTFQLADAIQAEAPDRVRGSASSVEGLVVECPHDESHTHAGDASDKGCFVMNAGQTDGGGFVWKCHHNSCQGRDRLDFLNKAIADGWFGSHVLDMAEYHSSVVDPCLQAMSDSAALSRSSSVDEMQGVLNWTVECDQMLVRAQVLKQMKQSTGFGMGDLRASLKEVEDNKRAEDLQRSGKPHFTWLTQEFDEIIEQVAKLFAEANAEDPRIFRMGASLVRLGHDEVTDTLLVEALSRTMLRQEISDLSTWCRLERGEPKYIGCPSEVAGHLLSDPGLDLPPLAGIVDAPFFDATGDLISAPGYHGESYTYYNPRAGFQVPPISEFPTEAEICEARNQLLTEVDGDFPFADDTPGNRSSKAHAIALKLEPFARQLIKGSTPIYLIQKPTPGTGATLFVNAFAEVAYGAPAVAQAEVHSPEELRKNLTATLMTGAALYWIDNVHHKVDNAALALATTTEVWKDRILGHSKTVVIPVRCTWIISGNNVQLSSELARRSVLIRLDANVERPTERSDFRHPDLRGFIRSNRGKLVWACLTLIQAWIAAGKPSGEKMLASYESWSTVMGGILQTAGIQGLLENRAELREVADDDDGPIKVFINLMYRTFGTDMVRVTAPEASTHQDKPRSLLELYRRNSHDLDLGFNDKRQESWSSLLGMALNKHKNKVFEISTKTGVIRVKLRADRNSGGAVKRLEIVPTS